LKIWQWLTFFGHSVSVVPPTSHEESMQLHSTKVESVNRPKTISIMFQTIPMTTHSHPLAFWKGGLQRASTCKKHLTVLYLCP